MNRSARILFAGAAWLAATFGLAPSAVLGYWDNGTVVTSYDAFEYPDPPAYYPSGDGTASANAVSMYDGEVHATASVESYPPSYGNGTAGAYVQDVSFTYLFVWVDEQGVPRPTSLAVDVTRGGSSSAYARAAFGMPWFMCQATASADPGGAYATRTHGDNPDEMSFNAHVEDNWTDNLTPFGNEGGVWIASSSFDGMDASASADVSTTNPLVKANARGQSWAVLQVDP